MTSMPARPPCVRADPPRTKPPASPAPGFLNQSHGEIHMVGLLQDCVDDRSEGVGLLLQGAPAPALDLIGPVDDATEELADVLLDRGLGPEAGVGGHLF